jgi:hypothetical protein
MGLMILEQQNKKRQLMARQEPATTGGSAFCMSRPAPYVGQPQMQAQHQQQQQQQQQQQSRGALGTPPYQSAFGALPLQQQAPSLFAQQQSTNQTLFGSANSSSAGGLFGAPSTSTQPNIGRGPSNPFYGGASNAPPPPPPAPAARQRAMANFGSFGATSQGEKPRIEKKRCKKSMYKYADLQGLVLAADRRFVNHSDANSDSGLPPGTTSQERFAGAHSLRTGIRGGRGGRGGQSSSSKGIPITTCGSSAPNPFFSNSARPTAPEDWTTKSVSDKVLALISLQDFAGSWSDNTTAEISRILGCEVPKSPPGIDQKAWVTLLLVSYLEVNCPSEEGTWRLVAEKARDWLAGSWSTGEVKLEDAEKKAKMFWGKK